MKTFVWFVLLIPELRYQTNPELCKGLKMKLCIAIWQKKNHNATITNLKVPDFLNPVI